MAHIRREELGEVMHNLVLYAIVSPFEPKQVYISRVGRNRLRKRYSDHINLQITKTNDLFIRARKENLLPPIYRLEFGRMSDREAYRRCIAWLKYFKENGYEQIFEDALSECADDLTPETEAYYDSIKDKPIEFLLQPEGGLYPDYTLKKENDGAQEKTIITMKVTPEEREMLKQLASENGLTLSAYCRKMTLEGKVTHVDISSLSAVLTELNNIKDLLKETLFGIYETGNYYPFDLENIQKCINQLTEIKDSLNKKFTELIHNLR